MAIFHRCVTGIALLLLFSLPAMAQLAVEGEWVWKSDSPTLSTASPMWEAIRAAKTEPVVSLEAIESTALDKLHALREWNRGNRRPTRNGITRLLQNDIHVSIIPDSKYVQSEVARENHSGDYRVGQTIQMSDGGLLWSGSIVVDDSYRLRVRLDSVDLPDDVQIWVRGANDENIGPFGKELVDYQDGLWTPSVAGPELVLIALIPAGATVAQFRVSRIVELFRLDSEAQPVFSTQEDDLSCLAEAQCFDTSTFSTIEEAELAVGLYQFINDGDSYVCTGGLINDRVEDSWIPYFLTANHCVSTRTSATSVEVFWDYKPGYCGGPAPNIATLQRTNGSELLVSGTDGDFTLLKLNSYPSNRWFLGWHPGSSEIEPGKILHRISHPGGNVQHYSQASVNGDTGSCSALPRASFIYQDQLIGGTTGGSSGAPLMNDAGQIVGQFFGDCGENIENNCDYSNHPVDGAMNRYWASIAPYIAPQDSAPADLAITALDAENGTYYIGDELNISNRVENIGGATSDTYRITFYASTNTTISSTDYRLFHVDRDALDSEQVHSYNTHGPIPSSIPDGSYYVGAILTISDADSSNDTRYDSTRITIKTLPDIEINPGFSGAWYNPVTSGQGFFIDVLPNAGIVFLSWFTYDTQRPPTNYDATLGEPGHRWLTAQGPFNGNRAELDVNLTKGGVFDNSSPSPSNTSYGKITLEFSECNSGTVTYTIPGIASDKVIPIERVVTDNVSLCESMSQQKPSAKVGEIKAIDEPRQEGLQ